MALFLKRMNHWLEIDGPETVPNRGLWLAWLGFVLLLGWQSWLHIVWRDEVRALNIAMDSRTLLDLFNPLAKDGHPRLWHALLWLAYHVFHAPWVLKLCSVTIAAAAAWLFLRQAVFSFPVKVLFIFGIYPFYEYGVMNRNYGLGVLLLFLFAGLYPQRREKIILLSLIVFLLAQANVHSLIFGVAIFASLVAEKIWQPGEGKRAGWPWAAGAGIMLAGFVLSWLQIRPEPDYIACYRPSGHWPVWLQAAGKVLANPGFYFQNVLGLKNSWGMTLVVWLACLSLLRKPFLAMIFLMSLLGMGLLFEMVYPGAPRHQGLLFVLYLTLLWLARLEKARSGSLKKAPAPWSRYWELGLAIVLLFQVGRTALQVRRECVTEFSSSRNVGLLLQQPAWKNAVILGEPDYTLEPLPYYAGNAIYIPREKRYGRTLYYTAHTQIRMGLEDILKAAQAEKAQTGRPVLVAMGHLLTPQGPFERAYGYNKLFFYSPDSLTEFKRRTRKIASFQGAVNENCDVYEVR